jgi:hypothetical protein
MRPGRASVAAGIAVAALSCAIAVLQSSSAPRARPAAAASTSSPRAFATLTPVPTPASALGAGPTTGPGGCSIAAPPSPPSGLTLYVCYTISGSVDSSGGFIDEDQGTAAFSCADWAENGAEAAGSASRALQAPDPGDAQVEVDGQALGFDLAIDPYDGPGAYASTGVAQSVSVGDSLSWSTNNTTKATYGAEVSADGSGSVTVTALNEDSSNGSTEDASESWVCVMATGS